MNFLRIVIIAANCYPYMGPRAHRTTELALELAKRGHSVIVYALLGEYDYTDISNKTGIEFKNLGTSFFGITDNTGYSNSNILFKAIKKIFGELFAFPFIELAYMTKNKLIKEGDIDLLITIAHPHSIHWGAEKYLRKHSFKVKYWIADCGDPYMGNPFYNYPFYFKNVEKKWCKIANFITVPIKDAIDAYYPEFKNKIRVIPQGFNFDDLILSDYIKNNVPTFAYSGIIYKDNRNPKKFMDYLTTLNYDFRFIVYSKSIYFFDQYKLRLGDKLEIRNYIPRQHLLYELSKMDFLINIKNDSNVQQPSKIIDYLLVKRPILEITSSFLEQDKFDSFIKGDYKYQMINEDTNKFDIKSVVDQFMNLLS